MRNLKFERILLFRDWERVTVAFGAGYTQDQTLGHGNKGLTSDPTVQRLPLAVHAAVQECRHE